MAARKSGKKKTAKRPRSPRAPRARKKTARGKKDPGGAPAVDWTDEVLGTLADLAAMGNTVEDMARILKVGKSTLEEAVANIPEVRLAYYLGGAELNSKLRRAQVTSAVEDKNPTMLKWLGIQRLGQRDVKAVEVSGTGEDGSVQVSGDLGPILTRKLNEFLRSRGKK